MTEFIYVQTVDKLVVIGRLALRRYVSAVHLSTHCSHHIYVHTTYIHTYM